MTATILEGRATSAAVRADLARRVEVLAQRGVVPGLGTVLSATTSGRARTSA